MDKISKIKTDVLMREWAEMVRECRSSGLTVKEWCINNDVNIKTYYYCALDNSWSEVQENGNGLKELTAITFPAF